MKKKSIQSDKTNKRKKTKNFKSNNYKDSKFGLGFGTGNEFDFEFKNYGDVFEFNTTDVNKRGNSEMLGDDDEQTLEENIIFDFDNTNEDIDICEFYENDNISKVGKKEKGEYNEKKKYSKKIDTIVDEEEKKKQNKLKEELKKDLKEISYKNKVSSNTKKESFDKNYLEENMSDDDFVVFDLENEKNINERNLTDKEIKNNKKKRKHKRNKNSEVVVFDKDEELTSKVDKDKITKGFLKEDKFENNTKSNYIKDEVFVKNDFYEKKADEVVFEDDLDEIRNLDTRKANHSKKIAENKMLESNFVRLEKTLYGDEFEINLSGNEISPFELKRKSMSITPVDNRKVKHLGTVGGDTWVDSSYNVGKKKNEGKNSKKYKKLRVWFFTELSIFCVAVLTIIVVNYMLGFSSVLGQQVNEKRLGIGEDVVRKEGYRTIALLGIDAEDEGTVRSDTIILANINQTTGNIQLISVYRDTFLYVDGWEDYAQGNDVFTKINAAYVMGESPTERAEHTLKAINQNLGLAVTEYISVDFSTLAKLVDAVGGIKVEIPETKNFTVYMNKFGRDAAKASGDKYNKVSEKILGKTVKVDGYQALGYCRVRKGTKKLMYKYPLEGENDYTRSLRQRTVITKVAEKLKTAGIDEIKDVLDVLQEDGNMSTSLSFTDIVSLATDAIKYDYKVSDDTYNFPYKSHTVNVWADYNGNGGKSVEFCDGSLENDVRRLHYDMYPEEVVTEQELKNVKIISDKLDEYKARYDPLYNPYEEETPYVPTETPNKTEETTEEATKTSSVVDKNVVGTAKPNDVVK